MEGIQACIILIVVTSMLDAATVSNCTNGVITLTCPATSGCVLKVKDASFGHREPTSSNCSVQEDDCRTNASFVWTMCDGKNGCSVRVPQERPEQPCSAVSVSLTINFKCVCVSCMVLPAVPANMGRVTYSSPYLTAATKALYSCHGGYELVGPKLRSCQSDGEWSGQQPACSVPLRTCPPSPHPRSTFGSKCYELVSSVADWQTAENNCRSRNGSLSAPGGDSELGFLTSKLDELQVYNYVWISQNTKGARRVNTSNSKVLSTTSDTSCLELYKTDAKDSRWQRRNTTCSYMNAYFCVYEIDPSWIENISNNTGFRYTGTGIGIGIGVGIILILLGLFCILCRDRKSETDKVPAETGKPEADIPDQDLEIDIYEDTTYDDTLPECDVTPCPSPEVHKYAQVDRTRKTNGHTPSPNSAHANYDEVYATMQPGALGVRRPPTPQNNTYENVTVHHLVGSLREKLSRPWRANGSHAVTVEGARDTPTPPGDAQEDAPKKVMRRQKPQPAPKPALRKSALEAKLEAIRAARNKKFSAKTAATTSPDNKNTPGPPSSPPSGPPSGVLREGAGGRREVGNGGDGWKEDAHKIQSGIDIVENDIYDSDEQSGKLTEL